MSFFENTRKPVGFGGEIMVAMMNLEQAGFCKIQSHKNKKGWLCVTAQK